MVEGEGLNRQGKSVWIGRGESSSAMAIPLGECLEEVRRDYG